MEPSSFDWSESLVGYGTPARLRRATSLTSSSTASDIAPAQQTLGA